MLMLAADQQDFELVKTLISKGADPHQRNQGDYILQMAKKQGNTDFIKYCIDNHIGEDKKALEMAKTIIQQSHMKEKTDLRETVKDNTFSDSDKTRRMGEAAISKDWKVVKELFDEGTKFPQEIQRVLGKQDTVNPVLARVVSNKQWDLLTHFVKHGVKMDTNAMSILEHDISSEATQFKEALKTIQVEIPKKSDLNKGV